MNFRFVVKHVEVQKLLFKATSPTPYEYVAFIRAVTMISLKSHYTNVTDNERLSSFE